MDDLTLFIGIGLLVFLAIIVLATLIYRHEQKHYDGVFRINTTDPDKDVYSLELNDILGELENRKEIRLKVVNEGSQEKPLA